jgi:alpha-beta hydrolase superfamily lysophospholipase
MPFTDQRIVNSPTGAALNLYVRNADGASRGVVQINHGLAEHASRYERFADYLAERGYTTWVHDHRGHGLTKAPGAPLGVFAPAKGAEFVLRDVAFLHEEIRRQQPATPLLIFGHSMGGMITLNAVMQHSSYLAGAAIWNSTFDTGVLGRAALAVLAFERMRLGSDVPSRILPKLTFQAFGKAVPNHKTLFDWLSRDQSEVDKYVADPLCGWDASVSMWRDLFAFIYFGADDANLAKVRKDLPLMLVCGDQDPSNNNGKAMLHLAMRLKRANFENSHLTTYAGARHETLNEINRDEAMANFVQWADNAVERSTRQRSK